MKQMKANGFSLIELMIVVAIIAILSAIAYPAYQRYTLKANRADAMDTLLDTAQRLERCYTSYGSYDNASCPIANGATLTSTREYYDVQVVSGPGTYTLTAVQRATLLDGVTPNVQLSDTKCTSFIIDNTTRKSATGTDNLNCW